jgi:hypothetical protein
MDCNTARLLLHFLRPHAQDLGSDEAVELKNHLADCADCRRIQHSEQATDAVLGRAMCDVPIPDGLRDRILVRLAQDRDRSSRRRMLRMAGSIAAAALVAVLCWWYWSGPPVQIDLVELAMQQSPMNPEQVEKAFRQQGAVVQVPAQLNYHFLTHHGFAELHGKRVPVLEFRSGPAFLRVWLLDRGRFDLDYLAQRGEGPTGRVTYRWWRRSGDGRFGYLVEYSGGRLEDFMLQEVLPAT